MSEDIKFKAMNIVNQLFDLAEVDVDTRQRINDECDEFVASFFEPFTKEIDRLTAENIKLKKELEEEAYIPNVNDIDA